jgi:iron complex outermembrane receptor protein
MINIRLKRAVLATALCGATMAAMAEDGVDLGKITVKGEGMREADRSFTVNTIDQDRIGDQRWENTLSILEQVPGFDAHAYQHGGVADSFSIRGFPNGGHGSDAGMVLDGISLNESESHADGYGDTSVIMPIEIDTAQVYKGPVSPLYGNFARSGVLAFTTRKGGEYTDMHIGTGSYDTYDAQAAFGMRVDKIQLNGALQGYTTQGWRDHSEYNKMNASLRAGYEISDTTDVALSVRGHGSRWNAPNYITHDQFVDDDQRRHQNPYTALQEDEGSKQWDAQRFDLNHTFSNDLRLLAWVWRTTGTFTRYQSALNVANAANAPDPRGMTAADRLAFMDPSAFDPNNPSANIRGVAPQRVQIHDRDARAIGTSLNGSKPVFGMASNWVVGAEYYDEDVERERWNTVNRERYEDTPVWDDDFNIKTVSIYGQMDLNVHRLFRPTLGFRYDDFSGDRLNRITNEKTDMNSYDHFSPKLGVRSAISDNWELRASVANGFGLPTNPDIKYNPDIKVDPEEYWQYEIGINGAPTPQWYLDLAVFMVKATDQVLQLEDDVFQNFGETTRTGIEGEVRYFPASINNLEIYTSFGIFDSEVDKHTNAALEGKTIPRMAKHTATAGVRYAPPVGWGGNLSLRSVGSWYTDDLNTVEYDGYEVLNGSVFYVFQTDNGRSGRIYLDVNNILDEEYSQYVGGSFNGNPSTYSPRPPTNVMLGFMMSM